MKTLACNLLSKNTLFLLCLLSISTSYGQALTIISTGQTGTSGTNWSISGNTLTVTGTASIQASVIENHLTNTGPLTIVGNTTDLQVSVNEAINVSSGNNSLVIGASDNKGAITTTQTITLPGSISFNGGFVWFENNVVTTGSGSKILAKANEYPPGVNATDGFIVLNSNISLTTSGGDIILWSNATNRTAAYGQANNEIILSGSNTLSTSGGKIVLAGGSDDGSNGGTASDGIPDGYAYRGSITGEAVNIGSIVTLNSGGGEIIIRGEQNGSDVAVGADATFTISNGGAVTIEGKNTTATSVALGTANIASTATNAPVTISGTTHITNSGLTTISTQGGDVLLASNVDDATDGESVTNGYIRMGSGLSVTTNGGDITIGGGDATGSGYALGSTASTAEGIRIDGSVNLNSGNGNIALRGKSDAVAVADEVGGGAIMFYNVINGSINSGTGTLLLDGYSQTTGGNAIAGLLWWNAPTASTFTIQSANTTTSAITLNGYSTSSTGQSYGLEVEATNTLNVYATGTGGGININGGRSQSNTNPDENRDIVFRGPVNILANSGPISIKGGQLGGVSNGYWYTTLQTQIGSKASTAVASSSSDITIVFDRFWFDPNYFPKLATSGTVSIAPLSVGFGMGVSSAWFQYNQNGQTMTGLTLGKAGNTADINHEITAITVAGPITVYGGHIAVNENLNTTAGGALGDMLLKASGNITQAASKSITTSGGDVTLWADSDGDGVGYIQLTGGSNSGITSGGGNIFLGGGTDLATGYARGAAVTDVTPSYTVYIAGVHLRDETEINSGGGNITLRGQNVGNSDGFIQPGIMGIGTTLDAGTGKIALYGLAGGSGSANAQGISSNPSGSGWTIRSASTEADAITLIGDATTTNNAVTSLGLNFAGIIEATGNGGGIVLTGTSGTTTGFGDGLGIAGDVLAASGTITITGTDDATNPNNRDVFLLNATLGSKTATNVTSSTANVVMRGNSPAFSNVAVNTSGTFTIEPFDNSFTSALTYPITGLTLSSNASGLTLGKSGNTADITIVQAQNIAGPISVYGGNIGINENLNTTAGAADGDVLLKASGNNNLANDKAITTSGGDVTFWSDSDGNGTGYAQVGSSTAITTAGGNITLGGGSDIVTGYARGAADQDAETEPVYTLYVSGVHLKNGTSLSSGGGNITLRGQNYDSNGGLSFGVMGHNATLDAGSGKVAIIGKATGSGISNSQAISVYGNGWTIRSSNSDADAIVLDGDGSGYNGNTTTMGINFAGIIESTGGGGIQLTGKSGTSTSYDHPLDMYGSILANSGTITITAENNVATQDGLYLSGATFGFKAATNVTASTSNIILKSDNTVFNSTTNLNTTGAVSLLPLDASTSFGVAQTIGSNMVLSSGVSGLTIGKAGNTANITMAQPQIIAGPIEVYGGTLTLNTNLTTTNGGDISLYTDNNLGGLSSARTITADGAFKLIPNSASFSTDISYPITNLNVSSNGLTIGKIGNTRTITMSNDLTISGSFQLLGDALVLDNNITCTNIELSGTATLAKDKYINASGNMTNNATLILSSDSNEFSRLMVGGTVSGSGAFKYQRWVAGSTTNDLISSPFPGETFGSLVTNNPGVLRTNPSNSNQYLFGPFDKDNGVYETYFSNTNSSTILTAGEGYRAGTENGATLEFTGTYLTSNQTTPINLGSHNTYGKWNLVGNPFPTYLDLEGFLSDNNSGILEAANTAVYAYDGNDSDGSTNWDIYNLANSTGIKIAPGQAFFVASSSGGGNLTFNKTRQTIEGGDDFLPGLWQTPDAHAVINLKNTDQVSSTDLYINANGSLGLDPGYDAGTYANESSDFSLYTKLADGSYPDTKFAIQTIADDLSQTVVIPLGVHINAGTGYSIALDDNTLLELVHVYLKDNATGAFTLLNDGAYFFETDVDLEGALRFELHLSDQVTLGTPDESFASFKTVYHNDQVLLVGVFQSEDTIEIYDLMGRLIQEYRPEQNGFSTLVISDQSKASGIYIVRINREGTHQSLKFLID